ncbi:MAG: hypothetical protein AABZ47_17830 [Planctomycetota bacterium]
MSRFGRILGVFFGLALILVVAGCAAYSRGAQATVPHLYPHGQAETMAMTAQEHQHTLSDVVRRDATSLVDDLDMVFMTDRPTRLTRWHDR